MFSCKYCEIFKNSYLEEHLALRGRLLLRRSPWSYQIFTHLSIYLFFFREKPDSECIMCFKNSYRGRSRTAATSKVELFVIIVNGWIYPKYLTQQLKVVGLPKSSLKFLVEVCMNFCHHQTLTHYSPVLLFYTPWKHEKTCRFSDVFRGYRKKHRAVMD